MPSLNFTDENPQKTIRILVYPNITFQEDLEKDSYIQVIKKQIKLLNEQRDDLWFYLVLTEPMESLTFDNVTQFYIDLPTYPPTMRSHFDVSGMKEMLSHDLDFDLVMSHLPEHTHALKNTMYNVTHHTPLFFGYCHWFDVKPVVAWSKDSFIQNITGLLEYDKCYLNTQHQKSMVLEQAKDTFNDNVIQKLHNILTVQHLGVDEDDICGLEDIKQDREKIIVFNHRPDTYKNFEPFMKIMDELWKIRQDFKVWIPLLGKPNRDYVITDKFDKKGYYDFLKKCWVGFSPKQTYGGWSVATTDGMMNGVPYIMYNDTYYEELQPQGEFFDNDHDAVMLLNTYLDDRQYRDEMGLSAVIHIADNLVYKNKMTEMSGYINTLICKTKQMKFSKKLNELIDFIKENGSVTKREVMGFLGWGRGIKFTPYRRALMDHSNIYDVNGSIPKYIWKE
tara:strand:+ start:2395 stop:3741 length:1347 start_codon:yes stop_codon:yes gene_type:complete